MVTSLNTSLPARDQGPRYTGRTLALTASKTLTAEEHDGMTILLDAAAGLTVTLPAASGSGAKFNFLVKTTVTSNNDIIQVVGDDTMTGIAWIGSDNAADAAVHFKTAADSDTITMNGTTKGGIKGDTIELQDVAADLWQVKAYLAATGTEATPFSAAVS